MASVTFSDGECQGRRLKSIGSGISTCVGYASASEPSALNESDGSFRPISTCVLMYSLPWMPSRVGRTISDMSVRIESNPGPLNGPGYPAPETGILPVSA